MAEFKISWEEIQNIVRKKYGLTQDIDINIQDMALSPISPCFQTNVDDCEFQAEPYDATRNNVFRYLQEGRKMEAIKTIRDKFHVTLLQAKLLVDAIKF